MNREEKGQLVSKLQAILAKNEVAFLLDYRGLNVGQISEMRKLLREIQVVMKVIKNRVAKLAVAETPFRVLESDFVEPRALVLSKEPVAVAKVLKKCLGQLDNLKYINGCIVSDGKASLVSLDVLNNLGSLPSREELLAQLLNLMLAPQTLLVRTLNEIPSKLLRVLVEISKKKSA